MLLLPMDDPDEIDLTPSIPLIAFSSGSVICDSIISGLAPAYEVCTLMVGGSMAGYKRTPRKLYPTTPKRMIIKLITMEATGRLIEKSDIFISNLF